MSPSSLDMKSDADRLAELDVRLHRGMDLHDDYNGIYGRDGIHVRFHVPAPWHLPRY